MIQNYKLAALAATMAGYLATGVITAALLPQMAVALPAPLLPALLCARIYRGLSPLAFRRVVLLLTAAGLVKLAAGWRARAG